MPELRRSMAAGAARSVAAAISSTSRDGRAVSHVPEYETIAMCGPLCRTTTSSRSSASTTSATSTASTRSRPARRWPSPIECFENGVLTQATLGVKLRFGDGEAVVAVAEQIARREGARRAAGRRREARRRSASARRRGVRHPRRRPGAAGARPALYPAWRSPTTWTLRPAGIRAAAPAGSPASASSTRLGRDDRYDYAEIGAIAPQSDGAIFHVMSSTGPCLFAYTSHPSAYIPEFLTAITGREHDFDSCVTIGERIENVRHLFSLREGINPRTITLHRGRSASHRSRRGPPPASRSTKTLMIADYLRTMDWDPQDDNARRPQAARSSAWRRWSRTAQRKGENGHAERRRHQGCRGVCGGDALGIGVALPFDREVLAAPDSPLAAPLTLNGKVIGNRLAILPHGGLGQHRRRQADRPHAPPLAALGRQWRQADLRRRGHGRAPGRPRQPTNC